MIEQKLGCPLLYLACHHNILEILLEYMISKCLGASSGQEIKLFQRFQDEWEFINQDEYTALNLELEPETKNDIISFCSFQPQKYQPRNDYKEFLKLAMITLRAIIKLQSYHFIEKGNLFAEDRIV